MSGLDLTEAAMTGAQAITANWSKAQVRERIAAECFALAEKAAAEDGHSISAAVWRDAGNLARGGLWTS